MEPTIFAAVRRKNRGDGESGEGRGQKGREG
jgi:hypothetical protein